MNGCMQRRHSDIFREPVDPVELDIPDYFDVITHPMDFGTIQSRLETQAYSSREEFAADMRRVFSNAKTYNPEGHPVWKAADTLSQFFEQKWAKAIALIHGEEEEVMDDDDEDKGDIMDASVESGSQVGGEVITLSDDEDDEGEQEEEEDEEEDGGSIHPAADKPTPVKKPFTCEHCNQVFGPWPSRQYRANVVKHKGRCQKRPNKGPRLVRNRSKLSVASSVRPDSASAAPCI